MLSFEPSIQVTFIMTSLIIRLNSKVKICTFHTIRMEILPGYTYQKSILSYLSQLWLWRFVRFWAGHNDSSINADVCENTDVYYYPARIIAINTRLGFDRPTVLLITYTDYKSLYRFFLIGVGDNIQLRCTFESILPPHPLDMC